ncbi:MAG: amino acid ABC transporter substrate-binding protein [Lachnospiraceae bacterium]|nr:amino acid ABC transporter substrate-binding protein [Lachnospiraceae bacterium]
MRLKRLVATFMVSILAFTMVACGMSGEDSSKVENTDETFVVGFDQNFPPFGYVDEDGEYTGFDIELAEEVAKRMGVECVLQPIDWDAKDMELESGTIDCIWNGFTINGREDDYTWSDPYMNNAQVFVVRTDSGITSEEDLAGKIVDVQKESSAETALNEDSLASLTGSFSQLISVADYNTAMMDLESGAVDAVAMDKFVALDQINGKEDTYTVLDYEISSEQYAVGFASGNTELRDQVNEILLEMNEDGTFAEISEKWFGTDVSILGK